MSPIFPSYKNKINQIKYKNQVQCLPLGSCVDVSVPKSLENEFSLNLKNGPFSNQYIIQGEKENFVSFESNKRKQCYCYLLFYKKWRMERGFFHRFLLNCTKFGHETSHVKPSKYDSNFWYQDLQKVGRWGYGSEKAPFTLVLFQIIWSITTKRNNGHFKIPCYKEILMSRARLFPHSSSQEKQINETFSFTGTILV